LATHVEVLWTVVGPFWRRRDIDPLERPEWVLVFEPGADRYGNQSAVDKIEIDEISLEGVLEEWDANRFQLTGPVLQLEWLQGPEADAHGPNTAGTDCAGWSSGVWIGHPVRGR
jgi:hypothetical protein